MGIFSRLINVVRANANSALDSAEDPEKMMNQMLSDLEDQKRQAKQHMAEALAMQKRFERDTEKEHQEVKKWEKNAITAIQSDKDGLAREALVRKKEHEQRASEYDVQLQKHTQNTEALRVSYRQLEDKIEEIKRKKGLLISKQKQAQAQEKIYGAMEGMNANAGALETIERAEEKVEAMQAKAEAYQELSMDSGKDSLEQEFAELESSAPDLDMELLALKKKIALPEPEEPVALPDPKK